MAAAMEEARGAVVGALLAAGGVAEAGGFARAGFSGAVGPIPAWLEGTGGICWVGPTERSCKQTARAKSPTLSAVRRRILRRILSSLMLEPKQFLFTG